MCCAIRDVITTKPPKINKHFCITTHKYTPINNNNLVFYIYI